MDRIRRCEESWEGEGRASLRYFPRAFGIGLTINDVKIEHYCNIDMETKSCNMVHSKARSCFVQC